jgi:hypothetical protein
MRLVVMRNDGTMENLTFAPEDQTSFVGGQVTTPGFWQNWDGLIGHWQATRSDCSFDFGHPDLKQCSLSEYLSIPSNSNATIVNIVDTGDYGRGGIRLVVGGTVLSNGYVDGVVINSDVYDFEHAQPTPTPTNKVDCSTGWQTYEGHNFKNQGACMSFVEANGNAGKQL